MLLNTQTNIQANGTFGLAFYYQYLVINKTRALEKCILTSKAS